MKKFRQSDFWYEITQRPDPGGRFARYYNVTCHKCRAQQMLRANDLSEPGMRKWFVGRGWDIGKHTHSHVCPDCCKQPKPTPPPRPMLNANRDSHLPSPSPENIESAVRHAANVQPPAHCSFCDKSQHELTTLIKHRHVLICNECVEVCVDVLRERNALKTQPKQTQLQRLTAAWNDCSNEEQLEFVEFIRVLGMAAEESASDDVMSDWQHGTHIDSLPSQPPLPPNPSPIAVSTENNPPESPGLEDDDEPADWWKELNAKRR